MSMFRTSNPMLSEAAFEPTSPHGNLERDQARAQVMTVQGAVNATAILLGICILTAVAAWILLPTLGGPAVMIAMLGGSLGALVLCMAAYFRPQWSPFLAFPVALCEGLLAGSASLLWSAYAQKSAKLAGLGTGLVLQATLLTAFITICLLLAYTSRLIKATENFKLAVVAATGGLCLLTMASLVLSLFGVNIPYLWDNGPIGIGFAAVVVVIAALNLVLDFDFIEQGANNGLPRHMNWYAAIGLLVTLVWLYISILRLLAKLANRR